MRQDVVIVGAGAAGLTAALASSEEGSRTLVVEKAPDITGTNTFRSGGNITISTIKSTQQKKTPVSFLSPQEKVNEALTFSGGHADSALVLAWAENIHSTLDWLTKMGLKWEGDPFERGRVLRKTVLGKGAGLNKQLLSLAQSKGVKVLFNTTGTELLTAEKGRIIGLKCSTQEGTEEFMPMAVILATSGFQANRNMLRRYIGSDFANNVRLTGSPFSTGDGHIMAEEVGAQLINLNQFHGRSIGKYWIPGSPGSPPIQRYGFFPYSIMVNKRGRRFVDESSPSDFVSASIMRQPGQEAALIFDEKIKAINPKEVDRRPPGLIVKFSTLEELSKGIGVSHDELLRTLGEFNEAVASGKASSLDVPKRNFALKIEMPPFYAVYPVWFGLNCTLGGPRITFKAQVVDKDNSPIPGLFACGEMVGGFYYGDFYTTVKGALYYRGNYGVTTSSLSTCLVFGRIAGTEAAKAAKS